MQCLKSGVHCMENVLDSLVHGTRKYNCLRSGLKMKKTGERRSKPTSDGTNGDRFPRHLRARKGHALGCHEGMLPPWCFWDYNWPLNFPFLDLWVLLAPCWVIHYSLGFWIPRRGFRITGTEFWIPCQWKLDFEFQSLEVFRIPWAEFRIPKPWVLHFPWEKFSYPGFLPYKGQVIRVLSTSVGTRLRWNWKCYWQVTDNDFEFILNGEMRTTLLLLQ